MQQNLLDFLHVGVLDKVLANCDSALGVIAKARSSHGSIEAKGVVHKTMSLKKLMGQLNYFAAHRHRLALWHYLLGL